VAQSDFALGIFAWFGISVPFQERMRLIRAAGFDFTSIWWEEDDASKRRLRHLMPDAVRDAGLGLHNAHVPYRGCNALWSDDSRERADAVARHIGWVNDCAHHEIPTMVMHVSQGNESPPPGPAALDNFRKIIDAAEDCGVVLAVENTRSRVHLDAVLSASDTPALGLCYDSSHDWLMSPEPLDVLRRWGHRLVATHFADTDGRRDQHWLPGLGVIDYTQIADALDWPSATDTFMLEVVSKNRKQDAEPFLEQAFAAAQATVGQLGLLQEPTRASSD
jgi:sugar phosphate isomerase/epimerase